MIKGHRIGPSLAALALALGLSACESAPKPGLTITPVANEVVANFRFAFLPIANAPSEQLGDLFDVIEEEAERRGIVIVSDDDLSATHTVQGYLSTVAGASGTILVYVFDVVDGSGVRVHRVSGQETATETAPDPWSAIGSDTLRLAAQGVVDSLYAWLRRG